MSTTFTDDDIDFPAYMQATDHAHKVRPAHTYADEVYKYFHEQGPMIGAALPWEKTQANIRFRPHEVTVWGGYNGHGKSLVLGQAINRFNKDGLKTCIASLEMRPHITLARMCRQAAGDVPSKEFIDAFHESTDGTLWMYDQQGTIKTDKMLAVIRYAVDKFKVQHFILDSLMKCGLAEDDHNATKAFIDELCAVARDTGVHIHLVHHSRKGKDEYAPPGKHDMKGTGSIIDQVDNLIIVWRNKQKEERMQASPGMVDNSEPDAMLIVEKQRNGEWEGKIGLWFDVKGRGLTDNLSRSF